MKKPQIVIVGAGFAGLAVERTLSRANVDITLIDKNNYHLFQPLLYQVATAALSPADIAQPIRSIIKNHRHTRVLMDSVHQIDRQLKLVMLSSGKKIQYDYLIIATGVGHSYFGHDAWQEFAPGLKSIEDATLIRRRILNAFEQAENTDDHELRCQLMRFVIVGGGPTGVEIAGTLAEIARKVLPNEFHKIDPSMADIRLIEAGEKLLPTFSDASSQSTLKALNDLGVTNMLNTRVIEIKEDEVTINDGNKTTTLASKCIIWAAGVNASKAASWLEANTDRLGRVIVNRQLQLDDDPSIYVIGDTAHIVDDNGNEIPGVAPAAKQAGHYVGKVIQASINNQPIDNFNFHNQGNLATIGRHYAVAEIKGFKFKGIVAWWFWGIVHIFFLIGFKNRISVVLNWLWSYIGFKRAVRLITHVPGNSDN